MWKVNWKSSPCTLEPVPPLDQLPAEEIMELVYGSAFCMEPVPAEDLLRYIVESKRDDLLQSITPDDLIRLAYAPSTRETGTLSGADYLRMDRMPCAPEQLDLLRKAAVFKDRFGTGTGYQMEFYETALFEICRRNDGELLRIYLDDFQEKGAENLYDAVFDYYIYMTLTDWALLKEYNKEKHEWCYPDPFSDNSEKVSAEVQKSLLDLLIQQAKQCGSPYPAALEILLQHGFSSCRKAFPVNGNELHIGMEFSPRGYSSTSNASLLLYWGEKELTAETGRCVDVGDLNDLFCDSCCAIPITCTCGEYGCGGISAVADSLVLGNSLRLYLPLDDKMYFFQIDDREAIRRELLVMLRHIIRTIQCHIRWQKKGLAPAAPSPYDPEEIAAPEISPYGTTVSCLQKQCKGIERELGL